MSAHFSIFDKKIHNIEKLPDQYILKRWSKTAKSGHVIDDGGIQIVDDISYLLRQSQLIQLSLNVVDKALSSEATTKVYTDALNMASEQINQLVDSGTSTRILPSENSYQIGICSTSVVESVNVEHSYNEPSQAK